MDTLFSIATIAMMDGRWMAAVVWLVKTATPQPSDQGFPLMAEAGIPKFSRFFLRVVPRMRKKRGF